MLGLSDDTYIAYCVDEAIYAFGSAIDDEIGSMKKSHKKESDESYARRRHQAFMALLEAPDKQRFASPAATT